MTEMCTIPCKKSTLTYDVYVYLCVWGEVEETAPLDGRRLFNIPAGLKFAARILLTYFLLVGGWVTRNGTAAAATNQINCVQRKYDILPLSGWFACSSAHFYHIIFVAHFWCVQKFHAHGINNDT